MEHLPSYIKSYIEHHDPRAQIDGFSELFVHLNKTSCPQPLRQLVKTYFYDNPPLREHLSQSLVNVNLLELDTPASAMTLSARMNAALDTDAPVVPGSGDFRSITFHNCGETTLHPESPLQIRIVLHESQRLDWKWLQLPGGLGISQRERRRDDTLYLSVTMRDSSQVAEKCEKRRAQDWEAIRMPGSYVPNNTFAPTSAESDTNERLTQVSGMITFYETTMQREFKDGCIDLSLHVGCSDRDGSDEYELVFTVENSTGHCVERWTIPTIRIIEVPSIGTLEQIWRDILYLLGMLGLSHSPPPHPALGSCDGEATPGKGSSAGPLQPADDTRPRPYERVITNPMPKSPVRKSINTTSVRSLSGQKDDNGTLGATNSIPPSPDSDFALTQHAPCIFDVTPSSGPVAGGIKVCVLGSGFPTHHACTFGESTALTCWQTETTRQCILPSSPNSGPVPVSFRGVPVMGATGVFIYEDTREKDTATHILKAIGSMYMGREVSVEEVGKMLMPLLVGRDSGKQTTPRPSLHPSINLETAAVEVLTLFDQITIPPSISLAEAVLLAAETGQTLLHLSASLGLENLLKILLNHGMDPNLRDANGFTALHFTALYRHDQCARLLVHEGADINITDIWGRTARHVALESNHNNVAELLAAQEANPVNMDEFANEGGKERKPGCPEGTEIGPQSPGLSASKNLKDAIALNDDVAPALLTDHSEPTDGQHLSASSRPSLLAIGVAATIQSGLSGLLQRLDGFLRLTNLAAEIHPWIKLAWGVDSVAYTVSARS